MAILGLIMTYSELMFATAPVGKQTYGPTSKETTREQAPQLLTHEKLVQRWRKVWKHESISHIHSSSLVVCI